MADAPDVIHGTAIALDGQAALICGPSGSGKSDLALRCLMQGANPLVSGHAQLVADDYVQFRLQGPDVFLRAPGTIRNKLEVRGQGIVALTAISEARLVLIVELVSADQIERLPDPVPRREIGGVCVPILRLDAHEASAACKLLLALEHLKNER